MESSPRAFRIRSTSELIQGPTEQSGAANRLLRVQGKPRPRYSRDTSRDVYLSRIHSRIPSDRKNLGNFSGNPLWFDRKFIAVFEFFLVGIMLFRLCLTWPTG